MRNHHRAVGLAALTAGLSAFAFGGWAIVTVDEMPEHAVAGKPVQLTFAVRQHGVELMRDLEPVVEISQGASKRRVEARRTAQGGRYTAAITLPSAGRWELAVRSGFGKAEVERIPIQAVDAAAAAPAMSGYDRGRQLFAAKGCVQFHVHAAAGARGSYPGMGPELTEMRLEPAYLARFLANPAIKPKTAGGNGPMPNLELKEREIAALVAFINAERRVTTR